MPVGTSVPGRREGGSAFKLWLRYAKPVRGTLEVDDGAARALAEAGGSLLPVGVTGVHGSFAAGDAVSVVRARARRDRPRPGRHRRSRPAPRRRAAQRRGAPASVPHLDEEVVHRDHLVLIDEEAR